MAPNFVASPKSSPTTAVLDHAATRQLAGKRERQEEEAEASSLSSSRPGKRARQDDEASSASSIVLDVEPINSVAPPIVLDVEPINSVAPPIVLDVEPINSVAPPIVLDVEPINSVAPPIVLDVEPINSVAPPIVLDAKRINVVPPHQQPPRPPAAREREPPPCLREHFLAAMGFRPDLPVHFVAEKVVTNTDLDTQQNRFHVPVRGVNGTVRAMLTAAELDAAHLLHDAPPRQRPKNKKQPVDDNAKAEQAEKVVKEPKKQGDEHGGLKVKLVDLFAGAKELLMARWDSSRTTVVKGTGYLDFIRGCSFSAGDTVEIWAFVQRPVRIFGVEVQRGDSFLHLLVLKKQPPQQQRCQYCPNVPHQH